jgi:hypothetical protein
MTRCGKEEDQSKDPKDPKDIKDLKDENLGGILRVLEVLGVLWVLGFPLRRPADDLSHAPSRSFKMRPRAGMGSSAIRGTSTSGCSREKSLASSGDG